MTTPPWVIRAARSGDADSIDNLVRAAFANSKMGYQGEAELVHALGADGDVLLSLVCEGDGRLIGQALFSPMVVEADGALLRAAALGPVAVCPMEQGSGVGSALIRTGLDHLIADGCQISFVLGHRHYYPRFGFRADIAAAFASPYAGPNFMAVLLDKSLQIPKSGRADFAAAFSR